MSFHAHAQILAPGLNEKQKQKLGTMRDAEKRLNAYKKYIHKDSIRFMRDLDRYWEHQSDSLTTVAQGQVAKLKGTRKQMIEKSRHSIINAESKILIREGMHKMPGDLEVRFSQRQLKSIYSTLHSYLIEIANDTLQDDIPGINTLATLPQGARIADMRGKLTTARPDINEIKGSFKRKTFARTKNMLQQKNPLARASALKGRVAKHIDGYRKYRKYGDLTPDQIRSTGMSKFEAESGRRLLPMSEIKAQQEQILKMKQFAQMGGQYESSVSYLSDSASRIEMAKKKAEQLATKYIESNPSSLKAAQKKMSMLMNKFSYIANAHDLSTAIKSNSLQGRTFKERLVIAINFQLISISPISIDFSPQIGYRFDKRLILGVGGNYRQTFHDSIPSLSAQAFGYKAFASYTVVKSFFAWAEYDRNSPGMKVIEGSRERIWTPAMFLGIGRTFSIHKKLDMTVVAMYNVVHENTNTVYSRPFVVRVGFQLSEIAMLKRRPELPKW